MARDESKLTPPALESADQTIENPSTRREHVDLQTASPEQIRADIERTRAEMDKTLDRLTTRVQPRHLLDDVLDMFHGGSEGEDEGRARRTVREAGTVAADKLKSNPMPATLIGAGLAWLLFQDNKSSRAARRGKYAPGYDPYTGTEYVPAAGGSGETMKDKAGNLVAHASEAIHEKADGLAEKLGGLAHGASDTAADLRRQAASGVHTGEQQLKHWVQDAPLAVGLAALAGGLLAGLVLPGTQAEDELMGEASDKLKGQTREVGEHLVHQGKQAASAGLNTLQAEAEKQDLSPDVLGGKLETMAEHAFDSMKSEIKH